MATNVQTESTVLTFNGVNLATGSPANASVTGSTYSFTIDLYDDASGLLDDQSANLFNLFLRYNGNGGSDIPIIWGGSTLNKFILETPGDGTIVIGRENRGVVKDFTVFYEGGPAANVGSIAYTGPGATGVDSSIVSEYSSVYVGDKNTISTVISDTTGNPYFPDTTDTVKFFKNGTAILDGEVGPTLIYGQYTFALVDNVEGVSGGATYSAFLQTGTVGVTISSPAFVNVYDVGVSLASPIIVSGSTLIYSGQTGDGLTMTVVLRDNSGNLYDNMISNYTMELFNGIGTDPPISSGISLTSTGSTYTFFFNASYPYNDLLTFTYKLTGVPPLPSTPLSGTSEAKVILAPRNIVSVAQSTLTADPFNVTNGSGVDIRLQLLDVLGNPVDGGLNTSSLQNLQGLTFAQGFTGAYMLNQPQDAGVTGQYTFRFVVGYDVAESLTFLATYNGLNINQIETLNYFEKDPSMVPCFFGDAPVLTTKGYVRIDRLKKGDVVVTPDEQQIPIKRVVVTKVSASRDTNPYVIPKGMFNATEKLLISPNHKVSVKDKMVESKFLNLRQDYHKGILTYYNIELERYSNMVVAGVNVESLICAKEVYVTPEQFMASMKKRYGNITPEFYEKTLSKFKVMPDGRIRCFATAK